MATFPGAIPSYSTMDPNQTTSAAGHTARHNAIQLDLIALATKVGADSSADTSSIDFRLSGVSGGDKAVSRSGTETLANKTLNSSTINTPTISAGGSWTGSPTIDKPTIADLTNMTHDHGSAQKGGSLATNSVDTSQIKNDAVTEGKVVDSAITSRKAKLTTLGKGGVTLNPIPASFTDVSNSSQTFTLDVASVLLITFSARLQTNTSNDATVAIDIDGVRQSDQIFQRRANDVASSETHVTDTMALPPVTLAAGSHTIKMVAVANSTNVCALNAGAWHALVVAS